VFRAGRYIEGVQNIKVLMKHFFITCVVVLLASVPLPSFGQQQFNLVREDKAVWELLLKQHDIKNKNLFYAGAVAYRDRLSDLSIETFNACKTQNMSHELVLGVSEYYIGKNLFLMGKYADSIKQFRKAYGHNFGEFKILKYSLLVDTAVAYLRMDKTEKARSILGHVAGTGDAGNIQGIAKGILQQLR